VAQVVETDTRHPALVGRFYSVASRCNRPKTRTRLSRLRRRISRKP
jgi:hypothetical protein